MEKIIDSATPGILSKFPTAPEALLTHRSTDGGGVWKEALQCIGPHTPIACHSTIVNWNDADYLPPKKDRISYPTT